MTGRILKPKNHGIVTLHGLMGTSLSHFGSVLADLRKDYRLFPVDLPGHGRCPVDSMPNYYELVTEWFAVALQKVGAVHVVAASYLGGTIAVRVARKYPQLFKSLTLTGFVAEVPDSAFSAWANSFIALANSNQSLQAAYSDLHGARWRDTLDLITADCHENYHTTICTKWNWIESLAFPVLLVNGDLKQNERHAALRYQQCSGLLQGVLVEGAGHMVPGDRPAEFTAIVREFWENKNDY